MVSMQRLIDSAFLSSGLSSASERMSADVHRSDVHARRSWLANAALSSCPAVRERLRSSGRSSKCTGCLFGSRGYYGPQLTEMDCSLGLVLAHCRLIWRLTDGILVL
jgi:hypothetical protein